MTGSIASSLQGLPRATHDIDFVIDIEAAAVPHLASAFPPPGFHFDEAAALDAIHRGDMFNLIEAGSGIKIDFWPLKDEPFDRSRFGRKRAEKILGIPVRVSSPEDTILMKLKWAEMSGGSEKQFTDALNVYEIQFGNLDLKYLNDWAGRLGVASLLVRLKEQAET
ncbi:MAG: hypothetical protein ACYCW5_03580 [Thermoleophilia bacterium]